jgi:hypothetical protein
MIQEGAEIASQLEQVPLGADSYGDPVEPCVVVADDPMAKMLSTPSGQIVRPAVAKLKPKAKLGLEQLRACIAEAGREAPVSTACRGRKEIAVIVRDKGQETSQFRSRKSQTLQLTLLRRSDRRT